MISVVRMPSVVNNKRCSSRWLDDESRRVYDIVFRSDSSARFSFCDREELRTPTPTQWTRAHGSAGVMSRALSETSYWHGKGKP